MNIKSILTLGLSAIIMATMCGCVDQHPQADAVSNIATESQEVRLVATSPAVADITDKLDLDLVGVCTSTVSTIPERYSETTQVGTAMSPDTEILKSLNADWILSPSSLQSDLQPKYATIGTKSIFLNLKSVEGMYQSIEDLGELFNRQEQAQALIDEYETFMEEYRTKNADKEHPTVLVLMGLPGSYIVATENSYVGSLVKLAGGINVYQGETDEFLTANTEDMQKRDPDIIVRCAHALPDDVVEMFNEEFSTNDIWKHFRAVQEGKVYDLSYEHFGMSAKFNYPEALEELQPILYGD
jgi:iron complex transport system substrate-binding protein